MVKVGDKVAAERSLITVEGDKASMEVTYAVRGHREKSKSAPAIKVKTGSPDYGWRFEVKAQRLRSSG